jgi:hypothetical protein
MSLSRTDLIPVLTIVVGGMIGASLSSGTLFVSRSADVSAPDSFVRIQRMDRRWEEKKVRARTRYVIEQREIEAAMDRLKEANQSDTPLQVRSMREMLQERPGLTPKEWQGRR